MLGQLPQRELLLVHAMEPRLMFDQTGQTHQHFRNRGYDLFRDKYYTATQDIADDIAPYGLPIAYDPRLININRLSQVMTILTDINMDYVKLAHLIGPFLQKDTI